MSCGRGLGSNGDEISPLVWANVPPQEGRTVKQNINRKLLDFVHCAHNVVIVNNKVNEKTLECFKFEQDFTQYPVTTGNSRIVG